MLKLTDAIKRHAGYLIHRRHAIDLANRYRTAARHHHRVSSAAAGMAALSRAGISAAEAARSMGQMMDTLAAAKNPDKVSVLPTFRKIRF